MEVWLTYGVLFGALGLGGGAYLYAWALARNFEKKYPMTEAEYASKAKAATDQVKSLAP